MKAVAYMLDTKAWSVYKGNKAEYAIGGPTLELLIKSYTSKYPSVDYKAEAISNIGYTIIDKGIETYYLTLTSKDDKLYVISSPDEALAYWIATPSANDSQCIYRVAFDRIYK